MKTLWSAAKGAAKLVGAVALTIIAAAFVIGMLLNQHGPPY